MIRRPPRSTLLSLHDALPIWRELEHHRRLAFALLALPAVQSDGQQRSEEHTSELQSHLNLVCRLLLEKKKKDRGHAQQSTVSRRLMWFRGQRTSHPSGNRPRA